MAIFAAALTPRVDLSPIPKLQSLTRLTMLIWLGSHPKVSSKDEGTQAYLYTQQPENLSNVGQIINKLQTISKSITSTPTLTPSVSLS